MKTTELEAEIWTLQVLLNISADQARFVAQDLAVAVAGAQAEDRRMRRKPRAFDKDLNAAFRAFRVAFASTGDSALAQLTSEAYLARLRH